MPKLKDAIAVISWSIVLGYFIYSANPFAPHLSPVHFTTNVRWSRLLIPDIEVFDPFWLMSKTGHFMGFLIMDALLFHLIGRKNLAACVAVAFAVSTELSQLFFYRDGRLYDMVIDCLGVALSYYIQSQRDSFDSRRRHI